MSRSCRGLPLTRGGWPNDPQRALGWSPDVAAQRPAMRTGREREKIARMIALAD